jgi:hypothetical protein
MEPIQLEDFENIQLYITNNKYESDDPFTEQIELKAKAPKLAQLRALQKEDLKKQLRCGHCKELGHNRRGCRNGRREPEVVVISSDETNSEEASSIGEASGEEASSDEDKDELA